MSLDDKNVRIRKAGTLWRHSKS